MPNEEFKIDRKKVTLLAVVGMLMSVLAATFSFYRFWDVPIRQINESPIIEYAEFDDEGSRPADSKVISNLPDRMVIREPKMATVRVSRQFTDKSFKDLLGDGEPENANIMQSPSVQVDLKGDSEFFDINLKNGESRKTITSNEPVDWYYEIIPKKAGEANLYLTITVIFETGGNVKKLKEYPIIKKVYVESDWVGDTWIYLQNNVLQIVALIIGLLTIGFIADAVKKKITGR